MKKTTILLASAAALLSTTAIASASTVYFQPSALNAGGSWDGGEFIATLSNGTTYRSFCLERNATIGMGQQFTYSYEITTDGARNGGISGGNPDPVSSAAASIFVAWLNGSIANNSANSTAVQNAIWAIEGELTPSQIASIGGTALALYNDAIANFSTTDNAPIDNPMFRNIRVLNPYRIIDGELFHYQSQIILIPLPTASGLALAGLAVIGTRRRR